MKCCVTIGKFLATNFIFKNCNVLFVITISFLKQSAKRFFDRIGLRRLPQAMMNGVPLDVEEVVFHKHRKVNVLPSLLSYYGVTWAWTQS